MSRIAFVFPGQGAQYTGMGRAFYEKSKMARSVFDLASEVVGLDIPALCFEENDRLDVTEYTQVALLACEAAILKAVQEAGIRPEVNAGLSLGEYGALIASGAMTMKEAFRVVRRRGIFMQEAVPVGGAMAAVIGMDGERIEKVCGKAEGTVTVANYNCPGQVVITGEEKAVQKVSEILEKEGARRVVPLRVSGPFHSPMLREAGEKLGEVLQDTVIHDIAIPYVANVTAEYVRDKSQVKGLLANQVADSVRWQQSVENMRRHGVDTFIEIGPGRTLTGFLKKIDRRAVGLHIEEPEDLEKVLEEI